MITAFLVQVSLLFRMQFTCMQLIWDLCTGACAAASMLLVYGVFEISGDAKAVCAGRKLWRLQWSPLCREKGCLHDSVSGSSCAGTGLLPKKLELYYLCRALWILNRGSL